MNSVEAMKLFLEPRSVAFIGASRNTSKDGEMNALELLVSAGFPGEVYPVNPKADEIMGMKCYPSLDEVPEGVDMAVVSLPRHLVPGAVGGCVDRGIKAIIVHTMWLSDGQDEEGKALQEEALQIAKAGGARIIGPNTFGVMNGFARLSTYMGPLNTEKSLPLSGICQSGMFSYKSWPDHPLGGQGPVGKIVDLGNAGDIDFADALEYYEADPDTKVIFLHIEGIKDGKRFIEVACRVSMKKPILAIKVGRTEEGAKAIASHTGAMAGRDEVYDALLRKCGIIRVDDLDELEDLCQAFLYLPLLRGTDLALLSHAGGMCSMGTDAFGKYGLNVAELDPGTVKKVEGLFPQWASVHNPLDIWPACLSNEYLSTLSSLVNAFLEDDNVAGLFCVIWAVQEPEFQWYDASQILGEAAARFPHKPICTWSYGPSWPQWKVAIQGTGILWYPTPERVARVFSALHRRWQFLQGDSS